MRNNLPRTLALLAFGVLASVPADGGAVDIKGDPGVAPPGPIIAADCDITGTKVVQQAFSPAASIPDISPAGVTFGPIVVPADGMNVDRVVLELNCSHTWLGDLIVRLSYDENSDGVLDLTSTVICRPGRTGSCGASGTGNGCGNNLTTGAIYRFDDTATNTLLDVCLGVDLPGGCYRPTGIGAGPFAPFHGRVKGGRWWLFVSDNATSDTGTLTSWSVYLLNTTVDAMPTSWGRLKAIYR